MDHELKLCQIRMLKSFRIENDPFIGYCKVYECGITGLCHPCLFDVSTEVLLDDVCLRCGRDMEWENIPTLGGEIVKHALRELEGEESK